MRQRQQATVSASLATGWACATDWRKRAGLCLVVVVEVVVGGGGIRQAEISSWADRWGCDGRRNQRGGHAPPCAGRA